MTEFKRKLMNLHNVIANNYIIYLNQPKYEHPY